MVQNRGTSDDHLSFPVTFSSKISSMKEETEKRFGTGLTTPDAPLQKDRKPKNKNERPESKTSSESLMFLETLITLVDIRSTITANPPAFWHLFS